MVLVDSPRIRCTVRKNTQTVCVDSHGNIDESNGSKGSSSSVSNHRVGGYGRRCDHSVTAIPTNFCTSKTGTLPYPFLFQVRL